jgi:hypothetical protein
MCTDAYREALTRDLSSRAPSTPAPSQHHTTEGDREDVAAEETSPRPLPRQGYVNAGQAQPVVAKGWAQAVIAATTEGARTGSLFCVPGMCSR